MTYFCMNPERHSNKCSQRRNPKQPKNSAEDSAMIKTANMVGSHPRFGEHDDSQLLPSRYYGTGSDGRGHCFDAAADSLAFPPLTGVKRSFECATNPLFSHIPFQLPGVQKTIEGLDDLADMKAVSEKPSPEGHVQSASASSHGQTGNWKVWPRMEEVFLIGTSLAFLWKQNRRNAHNF